jgi:hypothetical protein
VPTPAPGFAQVIFYHDDVTMPSPAGSYGVDYYYAGCLNPMLGITGITAVSGATANPDGSDSITLFVNKCGINDNAACAKKTTYEYVILQLDQITNTAIKTVSAPDSNGFTTTTVKFCIRHRMLSSTGQENGYKQADVTFKWDKDSGGAFSGITTEVNDTDSPTLDVGTVTLAVVLCAEGTTAPPSNYAQGEVIQLCLSASVTGPAVVTIVKVNTLRFWIDILPDGLLGVYEVGETTQVGMTNGLPAGTTTILPAGAGTTSNVYCTQSFSGYNPSSGSGCVLSTYLGSAFFVPGSSTTTTVRFAGTVTIEFGDGNNRRRRVLSLRGDHHHRSAQQVKVGDQFNKPYTSSVMITPADVRNDGSTCSCSGFFLFKIICWFFKCLLGFK